MVYQKKFMLRLAGFMMKTFLLLLLISYSNCKAHEVTRHSNWHLLDHETCGESFSDRIIGGSIAALGQFPWMVRLGYVRRNDPKGHVKFRCGGSLINQFYVVTAGHCIGTSFFLRILRLGENDATTDPDCDANFCGPYVQDFEPEHVIIHRNYMNPHLRNDIALVRLSAPAQLNEFVAPICLPYSSLLPKNYVGSIMETAGWGVTNIVLHSPSPVLLHVRVPVVNNTQCEQALSKYAHIKLGNGQLCAGGQVGYDSCSGDSGGPLMKVETVDGSPKYFLLGVVSFGFEHCGEEDAPAVYTKVTKYIVWILNNIEP